MSTEQTQQNREARRQRAERFIAVARLILLWERVWPAMWPGLGIVGLGMVLALVGLFGAIPGSIHATILVALIGATLFMFWRSFSHFRAPRWEDGARRVERDSELPNRPITEGTDKVAAGKGDPLAERLWRAHIVRLLAAAKSLKLGLPAPGMWKRDPYGVRFAVLLGLIVGFVIAGPQSGQRLLSGLLPAFSNGQDNSVFVAWVSPPGYTGLPPRSLTDTTVMTAGGDIQAPINSTLVMRLRGTDSRPSIDVRPVPKGGQPKFAKGDAGYEAKVNIASNSHISVRLGSHSYGDYRFITIPDQPPTISFAEAPAAQQNASLKLSYKATDDYGVVKAAVIIRPLDDKGTELKSATPLTVELPVPGAGKSISDVVYRDLTAHAFAGSNVHISLEATDAAGQTGRSTVLTIKLPQRVFTEPLAQALIEQRKNLAVGGETARPRVQTAVDALSLGADQFYKNDYGNYLALRALEHRLDSPKNDPGFQGSQNMMWDMALAIEEGDLANAAEELRKLQDQLMDALERGAPDEEIRALMDKLRQAMNRYMQQLAKNAQKGGQQMGQMPPNARMMSQKDLQDLLKAIEDLARTGNRDQARQMLSALMQMMENMRMVAGNQRGGQQGQQGQNGQAQQGTPQQNAMNDALQGLGDIMGGQRQLLDQTFRAQRGQQGQQGQGQQGQQGQGQMGQGQQGQQGGQPGQGGGYGGRFGQQFPFGQFGQQYGYGQQFGRQGQPYPGQPNGQPVDPKLAQGLAQDQQGLRDKLDKVIQGLGKNGVQMPNGLDQAGREMGTARDNLNGSQLGTAEQAQQRALDQLRSSAQQLAKNLMAANAQQQGAGNDQNGQRTDPLGRPLDQAGSMAGGAVKLPDQSELDRAREILEELQRRSGEATRGQEELDYIDRLLKSFN
ncbi:MAG TPA: TIGR02302 family protein [Micropepsaceae bacterium]|nr:TIGR02302 family protein [Micropepsaceae bacterium]